MHHTNIYTVCESSPVSLQLEFWFACSSPSLQTFWRPMFPLRTCCSGYTCPTSSSRSSCSHALRHRRIRSLKQCPFLRPRKGSDNLTHGLLVCSKYSNPELRQMRRYLCATWSRYGSQMYFLMHGMQRSRFTICVDMSLCTRESFYSRVEKEVNDPKRPTEGHIQTSFKHR